MRTWYMVGALALWASAAAAHSSLLASYPENGAVVATAPDEITLKFSAKIRLTKVTLFLDTGAEIDLPSPNVAFDTTHTIALSVTSSGTYQVAWRGLSDDGHPINGVLSFAVGGT